MLFVRNFILFIIIQIMFNVLQRITMYIEQNIFIKNIVEFKTPAV